MPETDFSHGLFQVVFLGKHYYGCMATILPDLGKGLSKHSKSSKQGAAAANGHYRVLVQPVSDQVRTGRTVPSAST